MRILRQFFVGIAVLCTVLLVGCSSGKETTLFKDFEEKLVNEDYEGLYSLLSEESQQSISEEDFITKYTNIYSGIQVSNIELEIGEIDSDHNMIPFSLTMDTVGGEVNRSDYELPFIKENGELRIIWSESLIFPTMESGDKVRVTTLDSTRGSILDRNGQKLATDDTVYTVGIYPAIFDESNSESKIKEIAEALDISEEVINNKLDTNSNPEYFVSIVDVLTSSSKLEALIGRESEGILIQEKQSRVYVDHEAFGRLLGYIGSITAEELEADEELIYTSTSLIGKAGLEQVYEETLRGIDGVEIYIDRDGTNIETIAAKDAQNGEDITVSIDSDLQMTVYNEMNGEKGSATAVDPTTGEILALVSSPSYNSNRYTTYVTRTEQAYREEIDYADEANRFTQLYSPGSTFKLITAATGLETGTIDPNEIKTINGMEWQMDSSWGDYNIRRINSQTKVSLREAIKYSDNIYFGMSALNIGIEDLINGAENFTIGTELNIGYPLIQSQISNTGTLGSDILLADTGYGQGQIMVSTLNMALAYSALSNNGDIMAPTLILDGNHEAEVLKKSVISKHYLATLQDAFLAVVEESDGTGNLAKINGVKLAGKTGTAEIKSTQGETGSQNGWFVATDLDTSKISIAVVVEDVQDSIGTLGVVEIVKEILVNYLK